MFTSTVLEGRWGCIEVVNYPVHELSDRELGIMSELSKMKLNLITENLLDGEKLNSTTPYLKLIFSITHITKSSPSKLVMSYILILTTSFIQHTVLLSSENHNQLRINLAKPKCVWLTPSQ